MNHESKPIPFAAFCNSTLLLALLAWGGASVRADVLPPSVEYSARFDDGGIPNLWDLPFWWIPNGGSPFSAYTFIGGPPPGTPARLGYYYHQTSTMAVGEGYGITLQDGYLVGDGVNIVYLVSAYAYPDTVSTDILVSLASTNAGIRVFPGLGTVSACTALRRDNYLNHWATICYLTNHVGVLHPEIEFHYLSGDNGSMVADLIKFTPVSWSAPPFRLDFGLDGHGSMYINYYNCSTPQIVLMRSFNLSAPRSSWLPVQTNTTASGTFSVPVSLAPAAFHYLKQQSPWGSSLAP